MTAKEWQARALKLALAMQIAQTLLHDAAEIYRDDWNGAQVVEAERVLRNALR